MTDKIGPRVRIPVSPQKRGSYNTSNFLFSDYEEMEEGVIEKLDEKSREILEKEAKVAFWS